MKTIKAITLTQPWATLVAIDAKRIETRSWGTSYRGALAIHAAKGFPLDAKQKCLLYPFVTELANAGITRVFGQLPLGAIVAVCELQDILRMHDLTPHSALIGDGKTILTVQGPELSFGDYTPGRYAWLLGNVRRLKVPNPARGALSLWGWAPPDNLEELFVNS